MRSGRVKKWQPTDQPKQPQFEIKAESEGPILVASNLYRGYCTASVHTATAFRPLGSSITTEVQGYSYIVCL
jgi:hypothetical protein